MTPLERIEAVAAVLADPRSHRDSHLCETCDRWHLNNNTTTELAARLTEALAELKEKRFLTGDQIMRHYEAMTPEEAQP